MEILCKYPLGNLSNYSPSWINTDKVNAREQGKISGLMRSPGFKISKGA